MKSIRRDKWSKHCHVFIVFMLDVLIRGLLKRIRVRNADIRFMTMMSRQGTLCLSQRVMMQMMEMTMRIVMMKAMRRLNARDWEVRDWTLFPSTLNGDNDINNDN